jgi:uncharacterized protein (DUF2147 family)
MRITLLLSLLLFTHLASAQTATGRWVTVDDETGKRRSVVEITERGGRLYGRIVQLFRDPGEDADPVCTKCGIDDDRHGKKVIGMEIIRGMVRDGDEWGDGTILDPKNGSVYDCKLWLENGQLKVRGYVAFFYRTQTWLRE